MKTNILEYFGKTNASYLHAHGKKSTQYLISLLDIKNNEKILEIGVGTGATLVNLSSKYRNSDFYGVELSPIMFKSALKRQKFTFTKFKINLTSSPFKLPYKDSTFDKMFIESVLAIQEGENLKELLIEISRVLKPAGMLVFNETIWLDSTPKKTTIDINQKCKKAFGIIQSNSHYTYVGDWKKLLNDLSFQIENIKETGKISNLSKLEKSFNPQILLSKTFDLIGSIKEKTSPILKRNWHQFSLNMDTITLKKTKLMEGIIFQVYNQKK